MGERRVSKSEFRSRPLELLREVEHTGERLVVTHAGRPVLQVLPYAERKGEPGPQRVTPPRFEERLEPLSEEDWEALKTEGTQLEPWESLDTLW